MFEFYTNLYRLLKRDIEIILIIIILFITCLTKVCVWVQLRQFDYIRSYLISFQNYSKNLNWKKLQRTQLRQGKLYLPKMASENRLLPDSSWYLAKWLYESPLGKQGNICTKLLKYIFIKILVSYIIYFQNYNKSVLK